MSSRLGHIARRAVLVGGVIVVAGILGLGWHAAQTLELKEIDVSGAVHADVDHILELAAVPDSVRLFELDPRLIADRVERAPWVERARVVRWLNGTLGISLQERRPAVLVIDASGDPVAYLDAAGFALPLTETALRAGYDVPLLTGHLPRLLPTNPIEDPALRRLLAALPAPGTVADALVAGIERRADGELVLVTSPTPDGTALRARLGRDGFANKLRRLEAFWEQVVLDSPDPPVRQIDLRFEGQVVTR